MTVRKSPFKDPLEKKWWKEFAESLKKDIKQAQRKKTSSERIADITCTAEDIGKPFYSPSKKKTRI